MAACPRRDATNSPTGVAAGRAAGAFVVGLAPDPSGLTGADVVVGSLEEVVHVLHRPAAAS
ncbi:hypothetical protein GCM10010109_18570 [Actinoplanes campanulatus]|nr:hypothetical protein GCM10010109_18570 [Actinoplanes campanulatus]GID36375.1 hypothetical protein Aca09nite_28810 [Actinoplanes campanulatus]